MNKQSSQEKIKRFPKARDFNLAKGYVEAENYTSAEIFEAECEEVFKKSWLLLGELKDLSEKNSYIQKQLPPLRASVIVIRGDDDEIRAFYNHCSHRAVPVVDGGKGKASSFRCPYHGWVYNTRGELRGVPCEDDFPHINKPEHGLAQLALDTWNGFIFVHAETEPAETLAEFLGELGAAYDDLPLEKYLHGFSLKQTLDCNWKFMVNAFTEGYHLPFLHNKTLKTQTATTDNPHVHYHDPRFMPPHFVSTLERNYAWAPSDPVQSFALSVASPAHSHSTTGKSESREIATHPGVNPSKVENFMMDQVMIFPNTQLQLMLNGYLIHQFWPVAPDKMVMETTIYSDTKPTSYREEFAAVYMRASGRDVVVEDSSMSILQQNSLKSGVVKKLYIGENEQNLRFFAQQLSKKINKS